MGIATVSRIYANSALCLCATLWKSVSGVGIMHVIGIGYRFFWCLYRYKMFGALSRPQGLSTPAPKWNTITFAFLHYTSADPGRQPGEHAVVSANERRYLSRKKPCCFVLQKIALMMLHGVIWYSNLKGRDNRTSQLLPIIRSSGWSGTDKGGKTKEMVEDR